MPLAGYEADDWLKLVALTVGAQLLGHSLFNRVLKTVGPTNVSMLILLEIPGAALIAALLLGQTPPLLALPAAVLLLAGLAHRHPRRQPGDDARGAGGVTRPSPSDVRLGHRRRRVRVRDSDVSAPDPLDALSVTCSPHRP